MLVDFTTSTRIERPGNEVAAWAADPTNAPEWYVNIRSVKSETPPPLRLGSRVGFVARFMGRSLVCTYEVVELVEGKRLVMRTADGPFPMETTYEWETVEGNATHMTLRNPGTPAGFSRLVAPMMSWAMRRANRKDLRRLKSIRERKP